MPNEWNITALAASWMTEACNARPELPFSHAEVENTVKGSARRHDLVLFHRNGKKVLTGEVKRPENPDGRDPTADALLMDAFTKASLSGIPYFFTWNINRCVLWDSHQQGPLTERRLAHFYALPSPIKKSDELKSPRYEGELKKFIGQLLDRFSAIYSGQETLPSLPLDEKFLLRWESSLEQPVAQTFGVLWERYGKDKAFTQDLNEWMKAKQGMVLSDEPDALADNLERSAKFSCYVLANKILFYKALRRNPRFKKLRALRIGSDIKTGAELQELLESYFKHAREVTRDYETIFSGDFGDTLPFLPDEAADTWRALSVGTDAFDFTQLGFEIIGQIFERLLSPAERHRFGQHYTRSEIVDLINAFCVRDAEAKVFDPSCGGGTFLVRAYARKKDLSGGTLSHQEILPQLLGSDISAYPAHLTTINLATRDLIDAANYPFVLRADFFDLKPHQPAFHLPLGTSGGQLATIEFPTVDAVVGNPPYIRQEKIGEYYGDKYKDRLLQIANDAAPGANFTGRSDIHCFFFPHAMTFLEEGGWMGFLVSSSWLDTGYGFRLQKFLLDHFRIVALIESAVEPWFTGARVTTVAVILQRESDAQKRAENKVRFVWALRPLTDLLQFTADEPARRLAFDTLRDRIENCQGTDSFEMPTPDGEPVEVRQESLEGWRVRIIKQSDLQLLGYAPFGGCEETESEDHSASTQTNTSDAVGLTKDYIIAAPEYSGSKWGLFLRAPDIFFALLKAGKARFVPLGTLAEIKRGITSGCDKFFFPRDVTTEALAAHPDPQEFFDLYGLARADTRKLRLIEAGNGTRHIIEAKYIEPEVHSLMEIHSIAIDPIKLRRQILLVDRPKSALKGTHVLKYIEWGEEEDFHVTPTCAAREPWYDLIALRKPGLILPKLQQYRHIILTNPQSLYCSSALMDVMPREDVDLKSLGAVLNSTVVVMFKHMFGRMHGREGSLQLDVYATNMMLVPDPRRASKAAQKRLLAAFETLSMREIGPMVEVDGDGSEWSGELANADRQALDDATLELLGVSDAGERERLRSALYAEITQLYRDIRRGEREMQGHRSRNARRASPTAQSLAREIWNSLETPPVMPSPLAFIPPDEPVEAIELAAGKAKLVKGSLFAGSGVQIGTAFYELDNEDRARYVKALSDAGYAGEVLVPQSGELCAVIKERWQGEVESLSSLFEAEAGARTVDEGLQKRIITELWRLTKSGEK
jgi:type I restriction-modification system DNA methylase subunit